MVPFSFGIVIVLFAVRVVGSSVAKNEELLSPTINSPVFATLKRVTPEAEAEIKSPLFV